MLSVAGYAVGSAFGAPGLGAFVGQVAGRFVDYLIFPPDPIVSEGPRLRDLNVQISSYGAPIPRLWGVHRFAGNVIWSTDIRELNETQTEGGCLSPEIQITTYQYYVSLAVAICEGPIEGVLRIWADSRIIYDSRTDNDGAVTAIGSTSDPCVIGGTKARLYLGDETQLPDPTIEANEGSGNVPAFRGLSYIVFENLALEQFNNRIPNFSFEVSTSTTETLSYDTINYPATVPLMFRRYPDGVHLYGVTGGEWTVTDVVTGEVVAYKDYSGTPEIPRIAEAWDVDEYGTIYATSYTSGLNEKFVKLDPTTLEVTYTSAGTHPVLDDLYVVRNRHHPYLICIKQTSVTVYSTTRETPDQFETIHTLTMPNRAYMVAIKHSTGEAWVVCTNAGRTESDVVKLTPTGLGHVIDTQYDISGTINGATLIAYDETTDQIIIGSRDDDESITDVVGFYDASTMTHLGEVRQSSIIGSTLYSQSLWRSGVIDGYFYTFNAAGEFYRIDVVTHTIAETWTATDSGSLQGGAIYDPITNSMFFSGTGVVGGFAKYKLDRASADPVPLSTVVSDICTSVGLTAGEIDVTALTDNVNGFLLDSRMSARTALQALMDGYFFDGVESSGKLKFPKRGGASVVTIPETDLAAHTTGTRRPQELITNRIQELELPVEVDVLYSDSIANYQIGTQRATRQTTQSQEIVTFRLPIVFDHDEAMSVAMRHLIQLWVSRKKHAVEIGRKYSYLDPADVITIDEGGINRVCRILQLEYKNGLLSVNAEEDDASAYTSSASGVPLPVPTEELDWPGPTKLFIFDVPCLGSQYDIAGILVATLGYSSAWTSATVYRYYDPTTTTFGGWRGWFISGKDAIVGVAETALADAVDPWVWDEGGSVTIRMFDQNDTLTSDSEINVLNGANAAILGDEIIQWRTSVDNSDGTYTLSGLLRGRKGTEWATGTHAIGDTFCVLSATYVNFRNIDQNEINTSRDYTAVSSGMSIQNSLPISFTPIFRNLMPYSPQHIAGTRDGSNNLTITWIRRTRHTGEWNDYSDVALNEDSEDYEVDILDDSNHVVRTIVTTSETASYTAAQQTTDGLTPGDPVTCIVYQLSATLPSASDRGFGTTATV